ncbi:MAG TPA: VWA domain-containing protein [Bryobacteraceae bacterium]|nr:VWA domain-containing protein [Bryobacteraceae bacterium]
MKAVRLLALVLLSSGALALLMRAQGPVTTGSETVAKKKNSSSSSDPDAGKNTGATIPSEFKVNKNNPQQGTATFHTDALTVAVDVAVLDSNGHFIPKIPQGNFRILEDNQPQKITGFSMGEAPMTITMVIEFSNRFESFYSAAWFQVLNASYGFLQTLKPEDYVAVVAYDLRPEILSDFSTNRQDTYEAMQRLRVAGFSEANLYDALTDTVTRMQDIEGRKAVLLLSSGIDTFSKITYDKARRIVQDAGVPVYAIGLMQAIRIIADPYMGSIQRMDFLQADNAMRTFAKESGGMAFFPRFYGEMPQIFAQISQAMRNQYVLSYQPTNQERDGKYRKIKVELINPETNEPLRVVDQKGKPIKYQIIAKTGYTAPRPVE